MATRKISSRNLVSQESIQFIRAQTLQIEVADSRPNTRMFVFFGGQNVQQMCYPTATPTPGTPIFTNNSGNAQLKFDLPAGTFNVGLQDVVVTEVEDLSLLSTPGSTYGAARGRFNAKGVREIWQTTETTIVTVERIVQQQTADPLAQSFFTYDMKGGLYLSQIDLFFQTKDPTLPVKIEIRTLTNGYPTQMNYVHPRLTSTVQAANVQVSMNSSLPTKFEFNPPLYLKEDSDYCFVVRSESNKYNLYTSKMGERSIEDGKTIFKQPHVGSMFRSENSITWSAEQFEDIKFTINRAKFDFGTPQELVVKADMPYQLTDFSRFSTTSSSKSIEYSHHHDHGLRVGDKVGISVDSGFTFNGIPSTQFAGIHTITQVPAPHKLKFDVSTTNATSSGVISTGGKLAGVGVLSSGSGYSPTDTISVVGTGSGAVVTPTIVGGKITALTITNAGSGYTTEPTLAVVTSTGTGAALYAQVLPGVSILLNKPFTSFIANLAYETYGQTSVGMDVELVSKSYQNGDVIAGRPNIKFPTTVEQIVANSQNETSFLSGNNSVEFLINLNSESEYHSPTIDSNQQMYMDTFYNKVNNQDGESITSLSQQGSINSVIITSPGSNYSLNPTAVISPPDIPGGIQATMTLSRTGGNVTGYTITNVGSGYTSVPSVTIMPAVGDNTGTGAAAQVTLTSFNSELSTVYGLADARYLTRKNRLSVVSNGIRLFAVISSTPTTSVDWYVRTSLSSSSSIHEELEWKLLTCTTERNKSRFIGEVFEYEFKADDLPDFDTYDLKCVMRAQIPVQVPYIDSYRVIAVV